MAYRIFISHVWRAHHNHYWGLIRLLGRAKRFRFVDLSVPKLRPFEGDYEDVRDDIVQILKKADVVLVIDTPVVVNSPAVQDELKEAKNNGIPIIAIAPPARNKRLSQLPLLQDAPRARWRTKSIVETVRTVARRAASKGESDPNYELAAEVVSPPPVLTSSVLPLLLQRVVRN
jgi:hypothetical protein